MLTAIVNRDEVPAHVVAVFEAVQADLETTLDGCSRDGFPLHLMAAQVTIADDGRGCPMVARREVVASELRKLGLERIAHAVEASTAIPVVVLTNAQAADYFELRLVRELEGVH